MPNGPKRDKRKSERDNGREYVEKKNKKDKKEKHTTGRINLKQ
jgi:hypothetical protein